MKVKYFYLSALHPALTTPPSYIYSQINFERIFSFLEKMKVVAGELTAASTITLAGAPGLHIGKSRLFRPSQASGFLLRVRLSVCAHCEQETKNILSKLPRNAKSLTSLLRNIRINI